MQGNVLIAEIKEHPNKSSKRSVENLLENALVFFFITDGGVQTAYQTGFAIQRTINGINLHSQNSCLLDAHQNKKTSS